MLSINEFHETVWSFYAANGRSMPWRTDHSPYRVLVSELMLQQTQVVRVVPKFESFMTLFPDVGALAAASLSDVLKAWQGLGYNRRAKFLHEAAKKIHDELGGVFPATLQDLMALPGVGKNTAGAIMAYAYDERVVFIETNVRTVYFHHFYTNGSLVNDKELASKVEDTLPDGQYREWYWALMDYGSYLKREAGGRLDQSTHYKKQAPLKGSVREVRGQIMTALSSGSLHEPDLRAIIHADERYDAAIDGLTRDGLIVKTGTVFGLTV